VLSQNTDHICICSVNELLLCVSQGYATVSLASYSGDRVLREWYNILSSRFMMLDNTTETLAQHSSPDTAQGKQVRTCISHTIHTISVSQLPKCV